MKGGLKPALSQHPAVETFPSNCSGNGSVEHASQSPADIIYRTAVQMLALCWHYFHATVDLRLPAGAKQTCDHIAGSLRALAAYKNHPRAAIEAWACPRRMSNKRRFCATPALNRTRTTESA
eukprot:2526079-Pleurochrysis_carterae.AAC.4